MTSFKDTFKIISVPVFVASLCCLSPVILVFFGLSTAAFAGSLADTLYGGYKWLFRGMGLLFLAASFVLYLRRSKGICTLDEARKRRNEIINLMLVSISAAIVGYVLWLYVIVEYLGNVLRIWK